MNSLCEEFDYDRDAMAGVADLFGSNRPLPMHLFPRGARVTRTVRVKQQIYGFTRYAGMRLRRKRMVILHGKNLAYCSGWIDVTFQFSISKMLGAAMRGQSIIPIELAPNCPGKVRDLFGFARGSQMKILFSQNSYIVLRGYRDGEACVAHYGHSPDTKVAIDRHARGIEAANSRLSMILTGQLPDLRRYHSEVAMALIVQREIPGASPDVSALDEGQLVRFTEAAFVPLRKVYGDACAHPRRLVGDFVRDELSRLLTALPEHAEILAPALHRIEKWIEERSLVSVPTHGDYAPRNLFIQSTPSRISGIIDWEWYWEDGLPGFDALKFLLEVGAARKHSDLVAELADFLACPDYAASATMRPVRDLYGLSPGDLWNLGLAIWLRVLWMGCVITRPVDRQWRENAVLLPARAMRIRTKQQTGAGGDA